MAEPGRGARTGAKRRGRKARKRFVVAGLILLAALAYLIHSAVAGNSEYYLTVSEAYALPAQSQLNQIKVGGKVVDGSIVWDRATSAVSFAIADEKQKARRFPKGGVTGKIDPLILSLPRRFRSLST